ncbi:MAG: TraX family protein [Clostridia bacterium]|nr:TraX family protein [Clostridia bacterium]MDY5556029.1 TraX family protein [Blautia sp.]
MSENNPSSFIPEKYRVLSGSALKLLALVTMFTDHFALIILSGCPAATQTLFTIGEVKYSIFQICRDIGRISFPIFCFLLVEGFLHTGNRLKYGRKLLIFALISEIPYNLMYTETLRYKEQNIFFTLFLGYLAFCALEYFHNKVIIKLLCTAALLGISILLNGDYGWQGFVLLLIMYIFRFNRTSQAIFGSFWLLPEWPAFLAFLPINMYNGKRGFVKGKKVKYLFYWFYPVHIMLLVLLRFFLFSP